MKTLKYTVLFSVFLLFAACPEIDYKRDFKFSNNSSIEVYVYLGIVGKELGGSLYPDTTIAKVKSGIPFKKGEKRTYSYNGKHLLVDTLCLFIFDAFIFNTFDWDNIKNEYKILKRYDLSLKDFENLKYEVSYPPTEAMKDMKMYPPYGSE